MATLPKLDGVPETMLATVYIRALETQRPDALLKDEKALELVHRFGSAFERIQNIRMDDEDRTAIILRNRQIDNTVRDFLARHRQATIVHLGCGLDGRFHRLDDSQLEWYDLDVPEVIDLRRQVLGGEAPRYHLLAHSAFEHEWFSSVGSIPERAFLFVAEGVFQYIHRSQVESLLVALRKHFPGAEIVFDAFSPLVVSGNNLRMRISHMEVRYHWGLANGRDVERWAEGIRLLDEWFPFSSPEPRLARLQWIRRFPFLAKSIGVYHYRLG
jgi:methyltransferase (TIGR00027 family)